MSVEKLCGEEAKRLVMRSPKYWPLVLQMYWKSLKNALPAKVFRASYFFCRHLDDVLDGDRKISDDPEQYVQDVLDSMRKGKGGPEIVELYRFAISHLVDMAKNEDDPELHFRRVIEDAMLFDYRRAQTRRILTKEGLEKYYQDTFAPVLDLALMIAGSSLRSDDMPEAITTQGHLYSVRDLQADLKQGIVNIPKEELPPSQVVAAFTDHDVASDPHVSQWIKREVATQHQLLKQWKRRLTDNGSREVCMPLIWEMDIYCRLHKLGII